MKITATAKGITAKKITYNADNTLLNIVIISVLSKLRIKKSSIKKLIRR